MEPIAVIGVGLRCPGAATADDMQANLIAGRDFFRSIDTFDTEGFSSSVYAQVDDELIDPGGYLSNAEHRRWPRSIQMIVCAALDALGCPDYPWKKVESDPAIFVGSGFGGLSIYEEQLLRFEKYGISRVHPLTVPLIMPNAASAEIARRISSHAPAVTISSACASSASAIVQAIYAIRAGASRIAVAGGGESLTSRMIFAAFSRTEAMASNKSSARGPFDRRRCGFTMGEGAGFLLLSSQSACDELGFEPIGTILGAAETNDGYHLAMPCPDGIYASQCMSRALAEAGVHATDVGHINAHGTGTVAGDLAEARAISRVFNENGVPITGNKGSFGHLIGGAGSVELISTILAARDGLIPPTANVQEVDGDLCCDVVVGDPRSIIPGRPAVCNSFAFGGHNVSIVV